MTIFSPSDGREGGDAEVAAAGSDDRSVIRPSCECRRSTIFRFEMTLSRLIKRGGERRCRARGRPGAGRRSGSGPGARARGDRNEYRSPATRTLSGGSGRPGRGGSPWRTALSAPCGCRAGAWSGPARGPRVTASCRAPGVEAAGTAPLIVRQRPQPLEGQIDDQVRWDQIELEDAPGAGRPRVAGEAEHGCICSAVSHAILDQDRDQPLASVRSLPASSDAGAKVAGRVNSVAGAPADTILGGGRFHVEDLLALHARRRLAGHARRSGKTLFRV